MSPPARCHPPKNPAPPPPRCDPSSPRSALSFFQVVVRAGKREITPALSIANTPLAVVINTPDSLHRGDSVDPCTYTAARDVKLTCKRLP